MTRRPGLTSFACSLALLGGCAHVPTEPRGIEAASVFTTNSLTKFSDERELKQYMEQVHELADEQGLWWASLRLSTGSTLVAQNASDVECNPDEEDCGSLHEIVLTGSRVSPPQSITNNQEAGVDEGDIVKLYKNFLIVLQDGRLFSVDLGEDVSELRFVDRINVYTFADDDTWYDELLISDNKLVVTGYSYGNDNTEISVLEIDDVGRFTWLTTYFITSQDYYSSHNYATRMVDGQLVIYTPMYLFEYGVDDGIVFPLYRQRTRDGRDSAWRPLFSATDVFRPLQNTLQPAVHTISVCPITETDGLMCRSTGLVGPAHREFYVSEKHAYVWNAQDLYELWDLDDNWSGYCDSASLGDDYEPLTAAVYRIPLFGGETTAVKTAGVPLDQFSLDARDSGLHALLTWEPSSCFGYDHLPMKYVHVNADEFARTPPTLGAERYTSLPATRRYEPQNRFTDRYAAYSDTADYESGDQYWELSDIIVVPLANPSQSSRVPVGFGVERLEVFGGGLVATGTLYDDGLYLSTIALGAQPLVADREFLPGYFESEGRSHAFNLQVDEDGRGLFGVPVTVEIPYMRWTRMRDNSDLAFFSVGENMLIDNAGMLTSTAEPDDSGYECEVSCYDWYGNARPIFIGERIIALSGSEVIEGALYNGQVVELARLSLVSEAPESRERSD